jgi:hypothetical protein
VDGRAQLTALAGEAGATDVDGFVAEGAHLLLQLRDSGAVLGTRLP